ncbi:hypothetical protein CDV36_015268 [Fusarium kuroshium]|uniref:DUF7924 domain-containing protein n=1 Tax=Fusarium kuroshium TaxID=2010991 RepID=A0A3M2RB11_9HYPO|nr:hypothetical protein CDV36_015268 [Fusarium kuroshium]
MNNRVSKAQPRRSRLRLSKCLQEQLLNAIAIPPPVVAGPPQDAPARLTKRQPDEIDQSPAKKARLTNAQQPEAKGEGGQPADKTPVLQHPKPNPPCASFLEKFVDPFQPGPRANSEHSFVLEWLESVGSDRDTRCRSDSHLQPANDSPIPRGLARSAPAMGYNRDTDGFTVPPTPAASYPGSVRTDTGSGLSSSRSSTLLEDAVYRSVNLRENHIHLRSQYDEFPGHIADLIAIARRARESPEPSLEELRRDTTLESLELGVAEPEVEDYFRENILPSKSGGGMKRSDRQPMLKHSIPKNPTSKFRVSNPVPDMLYGYSRPGAFTASQQIQLGSMGKQVQANNLDLIYPFFVLEFKGDGPAGTGSMWVATNQCLGGSATCVNMADRLNRQLRECEDMTVQEVNTATFSVATNGVEARLFISWKHDDLDFYMQKVNSFLLQQPEQYLEFRRHIRNIIDWGKNKRLKDIGDSLDILLEESRKRTSAAAKSRMPLSTESASSSSSSSSRKTHKTSSTRQKSGRSNSTQGQSSGAEEYWEWDETIGRWFHRNADGTLSWAEEGGQRPGTMLTG